MLEFIEFNLQRPLSLRDLVAFSRLSASTVERLFRDHLNRSPVSWILATRIKRAQSVLLARQFSVAQVAAQVGIPDPYYFSKRFKKQTGQSPREYRKKTTWI
jgi:transcriptional regulator GlxA family with amidase domain